jgi:hypothetical protein
MQDMKIPETFGLYAILTDPIKGYEYMTGLLVDHEIAFIQLRMKTEPSDIILATAEKLRIITQGSSSRFIINDHADIAAKVNASGRAPSSVSPPTPRPRPAPPATCDRTTSASVRYSRHLPKKKPIRPLVLMVCRQ